MMKSRGEVEEDVVVPEEVIQNIQSRLAVEEAARTSVLSKSWLHAWSSIPTLRFFHRPTLQVEEKEKMMGLVDMDRTLVRYIRDKIPIERFDLVIDIEKRESASLVEKWFRLLATSCVKELSLLIVLHGASFNLPYEILSCENLTKLRVVSSRGMHSCYLTTSNNNPGGGDNIKCASSLREVHFDSVHVSQQILDGMLSSCRLLAKIELVLYSLHLNTITVKNLACLTELRIYRYDHELSTTDLEVGHVPNLGIFSCDVEFWPRLAARSPFKKPVPESIIPSLLLGGLGRSVTQLSLGGSRLITDDTSLDMIKSGFPLLESLTLGMTCWMLGSFHFRCRAGLKRLCLLACPHTLIDVQVHAPKLVFFQFDGRDKLPSTLLFPISSTLEQTSLGMNINDMAAVDASFFLMMREALTLSHKCDLRIHVSSSNYDMKNIIDDVRARLRFPPARNVQHLSFQTSGDKCLWKRSPFFDALFEICHPKHIFAKPDTRFRHKNHFCRLMHQLLLSNRTATTTSKMNWPRYLNLVQTRPHPHHKWKTLTTQQHDPHTKTFLHASSAPMHFNLNWHHQPC